MTETRWEGDQAQVSADGKGWLVGPWNSAVAAAIGFADRGVDDSHAHDQMHEIYLVARGRSTAVVEGETVPLTVGDVLVVEPGEAHTFTSITPDYLHFVIQTPFVPGDKRPS